MMTLISMTPHGQHWAFAVYRKDGRHAKLVRSFIQDECGPTETLEALRTIYTPPRPRRLRRAWRRGWTGEVVALRPALADTGVTP